VIPDRLKRDYVVVGAGAIGGTLAFHLARASHSVQVIDTDRGHVAAIQEHGIAILREGTSECTTVLADTPDEAEVTRVHRVLLSVKGVGATELAARWILPRLAPDGFVVCLQNGLLVQQVAEIVGPDRTVAAFVDFFADVVAPGVIADGGGGTLRVGELSGLLSTRVEEVVRDLQAWGPAESTTNILGYLWAKLGFSAMLAATAFADEPMADLIDRHRHVMLALTGEVFEVAAVRGIELEAFDAFDPAALVGEPAERTAGIERLVRWLRTQSKTRSGVWRDIAVRKRPSEAPARYAEVVKMGRDAGVATPHLEALIRTLHDLEAGRRTMSEENLRALEREGGPASRW
jgi:2-dehydropantoate 2-reductase